jgi:ribosome biogenesis GTPase
VGVPAVLTSGTRGDGLAELASHLKPGATAVFLGSSGVGKSTLVNALLGSERQRVSTVRAGDGRGRHVTTSRALIGLPGGALLIDTPGLRQVALGQSASSSALGTVFGDVAQLAQGCRFRDCRHQTEPGCAVAEAEQAGRLDAQRLDSYRRLERERDYLESRESPASRAGRLRRTKILMKAQKRFYRDEKAE